MAGAPLGVTFIPSQEQAAQAPHQGALTGNVQDAYRILSLQIPRTPGAKAITPTSNLTGAGSAGLPSSASVGGETGSLSPDAAILRAILKRMMDGGASSDPYSNPAPAPMAPAPMSQAPSNPYQSAPAANPFTPEPTANPFSSAFANLFSQPSSPFSTSQWPEDNTPPSSVLRPKITIGQEPDQAPTDAGPIGSPDNFGQLTPISPTPYMAPNEKKAAAISKKYGY